MAVFPERQIDIVELAKNVSEGLANNPGIYPNPPVSTVDMTTNLVALIAADSDAVAKAAAAEEATSEKNAQLAALVKKMKDNLRYAEVTVDFDDDKLKLLGWGGRAAPTPLEKPGQCTDFRATEEGEGTIDFAWKAPDSGGKPGSYRVMRREHGGHTWALAEAVFETHVHLEDQETGKTWDYCVVASNKAGHGRESNIVTAVL